MQGIKNSLLLVLLWSLGIQAAIWNELPKAFKAGETYRYKYSSQALSGFPKTSAEFSGLQVNSVAEFSVESSSKVIMTLKETEIFETDKPVVTRKPYSFGAKSNFKKIALDSDKLKLLMLPVTFNWNLKDKMADFQTHPKDHPLSINIKRGILNMVNMKMNLLKSELEKEGGSYSVTEDEGIDGVCGATYMWSLFPYKTPGIESKNTRTISITRMKSMNRCKVSEGYWLSNFIFTKSRNAFNKTLVKNVNEASMNLTVTQPNMFFVWEASSRSSYSMEPKKMSEETLNTYVVQNLVYFNTTKSTPNDATKNMNKASLIMDLSKAELKLTDQDKAKIMNLILKSTNLGENVLPELIPLLRLADEDQIKDISSKVRRWANTDADIQTQYLDALAQVLTYASTKSLIQDFILNPEGIQIVDREMALRIGAMAGISHVKDAKFIDLLTNAASSSILLKGRVLINTLKTIWLTIGSLAGTHYSQNPKYDIKSSVKYFTKIVKATQCDMSVETKTIVILKALGNMGVTECLSYLKETLNDKTKPLALRVQAIYSLRKLPRKSGKIQQLVLRIFSDVNEDVELRIAASVDLILRSKGKSILNLIVSRMEQEPIKQVRAFMQDLIYQLSKVPMYKDIYRPLLRRITIKDYSREYSRGFMMPIKTGIAAVSMVYTPDSSIPRSGNMMFFDYKFGKSLIPFEIGFRFDNRKSKNYESYSDMKEYVTSILKAASMPRKNEPPTMTTFLKRYDNEIMYTSVDDELLNSVKLETMSDMMAFMTGKKTINMKCNRKIVANGEVFLPTTMGVQFTAKIHKVIDIRMEYNFSRTMDKVSKSAGTKVEMIPYVMSNAILDFGIDAGLIKSGVNSELLFTTPDPMKLIMSLDDQQQALSLGFKKRSKNANLLKVRLERRFKVTRYGNLSDLSGVTKYSPVNPLYVSKKDLRKVKNDTYPFLFGMELTKAYYCDIGKPRNDGVRMSILSAGDAFVDFWIKKTKAECDFDEFRVDIKKEKFHSTRKYVVSANHIKNGNVDLKFDLMTLQLVFGKDNRVDLTWPDKLKYVFKALKVLSKSDKQPEFKYTKLSGSLKFPLPLKFDMKNPLKVMRYKDGYSYVFTSKTTNPKGEVIMNNKFVIGMDEDAEDLAKAIAKDPAKYGSHCDLIAQCAEDIASKMPNSPSCFNEWKSLNKFNKLSVNLNWTSEGFTRFKRIYNRLNRRVSFAQYLKSEKLSDDKNSYKMETLISPFFYRAAISKIAMDSVSNEYKRIIYPRTSLRWNMFKRINKMSGEDKEYKNCQFRIGANNVALVKTFDGYYYSVDKFMPQVEKTEIKKMIFLQDDNSTIQVSGMKTTTDSIIQVIAVGLPVIRVIKTGNNIKFNVNNVDSNGPTVKVLDKVVATITILTKHIYGDQKVYEIDIPKYEIKVLTDMQGMLDIMATKTYRASLRGPCGDMDGEVYNEFKNAACTGAFASPVTLFKNSEFPQIVENLSQETEANSFLDTKVCPAYMKLGLL